MQLKLIHIQVQYHYKDERIKIALEISPLVTRSRMDIDSAFHNLAIHVDDILILAFTLYQCIASLQSHLQLQDIWEGGNTGEWVIKHHTRRHHMWHYPGDSSLLGRSFNNTLTFIWEFTQILQELSLPLVEKKTIGPCVVREYLGMLLDFFHQMVGIPKEKRKRLFGAGGRIDFCA